MDGAWGACNQAKNILKMKKWMIYLSLIFILPSLVVASSLESSKTDYSRPEKVALSISCSGDWVVQVFNAKTPVPEMVDVSAGKGSSSFSYNTASDSSDGKYLASLSCEDQTTDQVNFCVDSPGCLKTQVQDDKKDEPLDQGKSSGGGGVSCAPQWSCSQWSYCSKDLQQTRDCVDLNNCELPRQEFKECSQCDESWVCSEWSECSNNLNRRNCFDEHQCDTGLLMPDLQKSCQQTIPSGYQPSRISQDMPPPYIAPPQVQPSGFKMFWQDYKLLLILGLLILIILITIILLLVHFFKPKHVAYNLDELKVWVRKERAMGTSNEDIRALLKQHTGWKDKEIDAAFESLRAEPVQKQKPQQVKSQLQSQPLPKSQPEKPSLPEYTAAKEEPTVKIDNVTVFQAAAPSSQKLIQKRPAVRKMMKFSAERTLFKRKKPTRILVPATTTPPKKKRRRKRIVYRKPAGHEVKKENIPKKEAVKSVKVTESEKSSKKNEGVTTTTTTTTVKKMTLGPKGRPAKKLSKPKEEVVKTVKTVVKKSKR